MIKMAIQTRIKKSQKHELIIERSQIGPIRGVKGIIKLAKRLTSFSAYELKKSSIRKLEITREKIALMDGPHRNNWR